MKSIQTLTNLYKKKVDDLKNDIIEARKILANYENKRLELIESFASQADFINKNPTFAFDCKSYFDSINIDIARIRQAIYNQQKTINNLNNELIVVFTELKKLEIFLKNKNIKESQKLAKKEIAMMNEIALNNFIKEK